MLRCYAIQITGLSGEVLNLLPFVRNTPVSLTHRAPNYLVRLSASVHNTPVSANFSAPDLSVGQIFLGLLQFN